MYSFVITFIILKVVNCFDPVRVSNETEIKGLDETIHGEKVIFEALFSKVISSILFNGIKVHEDRYFLSCMPSSQDRLR